MTTTLTQFEEEKLRDEWHDFVYKVLPHTNPADTERIIAEWWIPKTLSLLHQQREMMRKETEKLVVPTDKMNHDLRGNCDFERNHTLQKVLSLLSNKETGDGSVRCCDSGDMDEKHKCL